MKATGYRYGLLDAYEQKENPWKGEEKEGINMYVVAAGVLVVLSLLAGVYLHVGWFFF